MWLFRSDRGQGHPWTAQPARAIRYSVVDRLSDWRLGRQDGRHGYPAVPAELLDIGAAGTDTGEPSGTTFSTNWLEQIRHHHHGRMEGELGRFIELRVSVQAQQVEAEQRVRRAEDTVGSLRRSHDAARTPPSEEMLTSRRSAEAESSPDLVRRRRLGEHQRRVRTAEERLAAAESDLAGARAALEKVNRLLDNRWRQTLVRTHRIHEHGHRRAHVYWRHLVRQHPQGDVLNGALARIGPDLPEWAREGAPMPELDRDPHPPETGKDTPSPGPDNTGVHGDPQVTAPHAAPDSGA